MSAMMYDPVALISMGICLPKDIPPTSVSCAPRMMALRLKFAMSLSKPQRVGVCGVVWCVVQRLVARRLGGLVDISVPVVVLTCAVWPE